MTTYNSFHALNPMASGQETFDAGIKEGIRRITDGHRAPVTYTREEVGVWRNDAFQTAIDLIKRFDKQPSRYLLDSIESLKDKHEPRYAVTHQLPVCDLKPDAFGCAVAVWLTDVPDAVDAFYGTRCNGPADPFPHFYYAGRILEGVTHWRYRIELEKA